MLNPQELLNQAINADLLGIYTLDFVKSTDEHYIFRCPYCDDYSGHFYVEKSSSKFFCQKCQKKGNGLTFYAEQHNMAHNFAFIELCGKYNIELIKSVPPIAPEVIEKLHADLFTEGYNEYRQNLSTHYGLNDNILKLYMIGVDRNTNRITIPIIDTQTGAYVNIRKHLPKWYDEKTRKKSGKTISHIAYVGQDQSIKYGAPRLFKHEVKTEEVVVGITDRIYFDTIKTHHQIIITEGELKRLLLLQLGYHAVTGTGGAGVWLNFWSPEFKDKVVYIVYDANDRPLRDRQGNIIGEGAGEKHSKEVAQQLTAYGVEVYIVKLPVPNNRTTKYDITDYFLDGHTTSDFDMCLEEAQRFVPEQPINPNDDPIITVYFSNITKSCYYEKRIRFDAIVVGREESHFATKDVKLECPQKYVDVTARNSVCNTCGLHQAIPPIDCTTQHFTPSDRNLLKLVDVTDTLKTNAFRQIWMVNISCRMDRYEELSVYNIQEILVSAPLIFNLDTQEFQPKTIWYCYEGEEKEMPLELNKQYTFSGYVRSEPKRQKAIVFVDRAIPSVDSVSAFKLTPEIKEQLMIFTPKDNQSIAEKLDEIYTDLEYNVVKKVWGRREILLGLDLFYNSALSFYFLGALFEQGWTNILCISDTGCGKSTTMEAIRQHYRAGELAVGEGASKAGLLGSAQKINDEWRFVTGLLARCSGRGLFIDEFADLPTEAIAGLSDARSRGVVKIDKVAAGTALCRTRLFMASNTREGVRLNNKAFGIEFVKTLMGKDEDIRRVDLCIPLSSSDIAKEVINRNYHEIEPIDHKFTSELCQKRTMWVWSRLANQVRITTEAEKAVLHYSDELVDLYADEIPLIILSDIRVKLCRLAIALAGTLFSCTEDGETLLVKQEHVDYVVSFMKEMYNRKYFDYVRFSKRIFEMRLTRQNDWDYAKHVFESIVPRHFWRVFAETVMAAETFRGKMLEDVLGMERPAVSTMLQKLRAGRADQTSLRVLPLLTLDPSKSTFKPTPGFLALLKDYVFQDNISGMPEINFNEGEDNEP